jgi:FG-GAP-like repeat/Abnormal spindle-like microcephaly-assoc'd, ASPM-SPD-2-Hydin
MCRHFSFRPDSAITTRRAVHALLAVVLCCSSTLARGSTPAPQIANPLVPMTVRPGSASFSLTVNGTGFVADSTVYWNGSFRTTTFVSNSQLIAAIPASDVAGATSGSVTVHNPGGTVSNAALLLVTNPTSTLAFGAAEIPQTVTQVTFNWGIMGGDFDDDGLSDIAINQSAYLEIMRGNGDGTFQFPVNYPIGSTEADGQVMGDFNNDGTLDFVISSDFPLSLDTFLSNPDGTIQLPLEAAGIGFNNGVTGDFNGDGILDLAVTATGGIGIMLGKGDGTFAAMTILPLPNNPNSVGVGDFNRDGILDLAAGSADPGGGSHSIVSVLFGRADGSFAPHVDYAFGRYPYGMAIGDLNGDGYPDIAIIDDGLYNTFDILLNNGDGSFAPAVAYTAEAENFSSIAAGDVNGDGKLDIVLLNSTYCLNNCLQILLGNGDGTLQPVMVFGNRQDRAGLGPGPMALADFNRDGKLDIVSPTGNGPYVFIQTAGPAPTLVPGSLSFASQAVGTQSPVLGVSMFQPGSTTITVNSVTTTGDFQVYEGGGSCVLLPGNSGACGFSITFLPTTTGTRTGSAVINSTGGTQYVSLVGAGITGTVGVTVAPSSLSFATQLVKTLSPYQGVVITNTGTATLNLTSTALIGPAAGDFVLNNGNCGATIAPGGSCIVEIGFKPTVRGVRTASLSVVDNASNSPQTVALSGVGTSNSLSASLLNFGSVTVGTTGSLTVTLTNVGGKATAISSVGVLGFNKADFSQTNNCGSSLAAMANCTFRVTFMPAVTGSRKASLAFTSDGTGRNAVTTVGLAGTGK